VRAALALLLLAACVLLPHWPRERADFVYDDRDFVSTNQSIRSPGEALAALLSAFPPDAPARGLYRPLTSLSYAIDFQIGGGDARAFHRSNALLYLVVVVLLFRLGVMYGRGLGFALAFALLYAVHPVHCDAVDAIAGRSELLALLFSLLSLLAFLEARGAGGRSRGWIALSATAYALACAAKETGVVLPAILAVHAWVLPQGPARGERRAALTRLAPFAGVLALYLLARFSALGGFAPAEPLLRGVPFEIRLHTLGSVFVEYLRLLVFPASLETDFYYREQLGIAAGATPRSLAGLALLAAAAASFVWLLLRAGRDREQGPSRVASARALSACGLAIFLGFLFPVSHLLDFGALMAERFLFAPSAGFLLLVVLAGSTALAGALSSPGLRRGVAALLVGILALAGALRSAARAAEWRDSVALWVAADRALPQHPDVRANLAAARIDRGELDAAAALLEESLVLHPDHVETLGNLGNLRMQQGRFEEARDAFQRVLVLNPGDFTTWNNLGVLENRRERPTDALACFRRSLELNPNFAEARRNLDATERHLESARGAGAQGSR
jgi:tetratricopeptide (TPR) repeat protein